MEKCVILDKEDNECGIASVATLVLKDAIGNKARVPVCRKHKAAHNEKAASLRVAARATGRQPVCRLPDCGCDGQAHAM